MTRAGGLLIGLMVSALATPALASAWNQPKGRGQVIFKFERMTADRGFDPDGALADLPAERRDTSLGAHVEYGLTDRLTVQFKGDWQSGEDAFVGGELLVRAVTRGPAGERRPGTFPDRRLTP